MKSTLFSLIFIGLLFFSCKDSLDPNVINVSSESRFYSAELSDAIGVHLASSQAIINLADHGYKHYLVLHRANNILHPDDWFSKLVFGVTSLTDVEVSLKLGQLELVSQGEDNYVSYKFSNDFETIILDGTPTEKLPQNSFDQVSFEFSVGEENYQGNFPEPGTLKDENTTPQMPLLSINGGKTINWKPAQTSGGTVRIYINHRSTVDGSTRLPTPVITIDDTGSFDITSEVLANYSVGDVINIHISRDVFFKANELLIRSVEEQYWSSIELI